MGSDQVTPIFLLIERVAYFQGKPKIAGKNKFLPREFVIFGIGPHNLYSC